MQSIDEKIDELNVIEIYSEQDYVTDDTRNSECCGCDDYCACQATCAII